jgi:hypothetical protein
LLQVTPPLLKFPSCSSFPVSSSPNIPFPPPPVSHLDHTVRNHLRLLAAGDTLPVSVLLSTPNALLVYPTFSRYPPQLCHIPPLPPPVSRHVHIVMHQPRFVQESFLLLLQGTPTIASAVGAPPQSPTAHSPSLNH